MALITDYPERLLKVESLNLGQDHEPREVEKIQRHGNDALVKFKGIDTREEADSYRGAFVTLPVDQAVPLEEGEYYLFQLQGIEVVTDEGEPLGVFSGYLETGANDVYIVTSPEGREILLPAIPDVIKKVDLADRKMVVHLLNGLLD